MDGPGRKGLSRYIGVFAYTPLYVTTGRVTGKVLASTHRAWTPTDKQRANINTIRAALPSCLACLISFRLTHTTTSSHQTKWFPLSSSTPALRCPRSASASGRSTARSPPMSSTTPSRPDTVSSMVPAVRSSLPSYDDYRTVPIVTIISSLAWSHSRVVLFVFRRAMTNSDTIAGH